MTEVRPHRRVLLDTGPLVAILSPKDADHACCVETLETIAPPLLTCWAVLTEAAWLLRNDHIAIPLMLRRGKAGSFSLLHVLDSELPEVEALSSRYADLSPQLADLTLLHLAQRENIDTIFTLDRRDFEVFRLRGKKPLRLLPLVKE